MPNFGIPPRTFPLTLFVFLSSLLVTTAFVPPDPLFLSCSEDKFTSPSYASNLRSLIDSLISTTPKTTNLFFVHTSGAANSTQAFGFAQCRPDASTFFCTYCLERAAANTVNAFCQGKKSGSVRNSYCVLRYADHAIASVLEYPNFYSAHLEESASNPGAFRQRIEIMLAGILQAAVSSPLRIAAAVNTADTGNNNTKYYGLAWCTADLTPESCYQCLDHALKSYMACCGDKIEGESATVSCIISYSNYTFFNLSLIQAAPTPLPPPPLEIDTKGLSQKERTILAASISASTISALIVACIIFIYRRRQALQKTSKIPAQKKIRFIESHLLHLASIKSATNNFSDENKLREGRLGPVYKGVLSDGRLILVKRLSNISVQRLMEVKNEAALIVQLQQKKFVKLLGCCVQDDENLLIYEYLPNASFDKHLYDSANREQLDWDMVLNAVI